MARATGLGDDTARNPFPSFLGTGGRLRRRPGCSQTPWAGRRRARQNEPRGRGGGKDRGKQLDSGDARGARAREHGRGRGARSLFLSLPPTRGPHSLNAQVWREARSAPSRASRASDSALPRRVRAQGRVRGAAGARGFPALGPAPRGCAEGRVGREIPSCLSAARQPAHTAASLTPRSLPTEKPPGRRREEEGLSPGFTNESGVKGQGRGPERRRRLDPRLCLPATPGFSALMAGGNRVEILGLFKAGNPCRIHIILLGPAGQGRPTLSPQESVSFF